MVDWKIEPHDATAPAPSRTLTIRSSSPRRSAPERDPTSSSPARPSRISTTSRRVHRLASRTPRGEPTKRPIRIWVASRLSPPRWLAVQTVASSSESRSPISPPKDFEKPEFEKPLVHPTRAHRLCRRRQRVLRAGRRPAASPRRPGVRAAGRRALEPRAYPDKTEGSRLQRDVPLAPHLPARRSSPRTRRRRTRSALTTGPRTAYAEHRARRPASSAELINLGMFAPVSKILVGLLDQGPLRHRQLGHRHHRAHDLRAAGLVSAHLEADQEHGRDAQAQAGDRRDQPRSSRTTRSRSRSPRWSCTARTE